VLGATASIIALCIWVQVTSDVSLAAIERFPVKTRRGRVWGWRVRARVRTEVEEDLRERGVPLSTPKGGGTPNRLYTAMQIWRRARVLSDRTRVAALVAEREITRLRAPRVGPAGGLVDWTDATQLVATANAAIAATPPGAGATPVPDALTVLETQVEENYDNTSAETNWRFNLIDRVLSDASYVRMRRSFGMVLKYIIGAAALAGIGIALFAWSTHPPKSDDRVPAVLVVPAASVKDAQKYLGQYCDPTTLKVQALGDTKLIAISATSATTGHACTLKQTKG
jgi:hypothetical protein